MEKKNIIIIVVVAVAAYLLWKKGKEGNTVTTNATTSGPGLDPSNLEHVIAVAFGNDKYANVYAARARSVYDNYTSTATLKQSIIDKAAKNGVTYEQQIVMDASWLECYTNESGEWLPRDSAHASYHQTVVARIKAM